MGREPIPGFSCACETLEVVIDIEDADICTEIFLRRFRPETVSIYIEALRQFTIALVSYIYFIFF